MIKSTLVAAFAFMMPFATARQLWEDRPESGWKRSARVRQSAGRSLAELLWSFAGNMHYVLASGGLRLSRDFWGMTVITRVLVFKFHASFIGYYPKGKATGQTANIRRTPLYSEICMPMS